MAKESKTGGMSFLRAEHNRRGRRRYDRSAVRRGGYDGLRM